MRFPLEIPPGINSDETVFSIPGVFSDGNNMRPYLGKMQTIGGWAEHHPVAVTGACRNGLRWADDNGSVAVAFGTSERLEVLVDGTLHNITPADLLAGNEDAIEGIGWGDGPWGGGPWGGGELAEVWPRTWSLDTYGKWLIANPRGGTIYQWQNDTAVLATPLTNAPVAAMCALVTPSRQVMAFGTNEELSGDFNAKCIRGSDIEDITAWAVTNDNNAFEYIIEGPGTRIVGAVLYGAYVVVWTDEALYLGEFRDDPTAPWSFQLVASNCGLASINAHAVTDQGVYWKSPDDQFFFYQVGVPPAPLRCVIREDFRDNLVTAQAEKIVMGLNPEFGEIWLHYPDTRDGTENSRFIAFSPMEQAWFRGDVARTATMGGMLAVAPDGTIYEHENGTTADGAPLEWSVQTSSFYVHESERRVMLDTLYPDFRDQSTDIELVQYTQDYPQATQVAKGPWTIEPGREKRNFRVEGAIHSVKFSGTGFVRFGKPSYEFRLTGGR